MIQQRLQREVQSLFFQIYPGYVSLGPPCLEQSLRATLQARFSPDDHSVLDIPIKYKNEVTRFLNKLSFPCTSQFWLAGLISTSAWESPPMWGSLFRLVGWKEQHFSLPVFSPPMWWLLLQPWALRKEGKCINRKWFKLFPSKHVLPITSSSYFMHIIRDLKEKVKRGLCVGV